MAPEPEAATVGGTGSQPEDPSAHKTSTDSERNPFSKHLDQAAGASQGQTYKPEWLSTQASF